MLLGGGIVLSRRRLTLGLYFDTIFLLMLKIRLQRVGKRNDPSFRLILVESKRAAKGGHAHEILGSHNFRKDGTIINKDRVLYWMSQGVQVSDTAYNLLLANKVVEGKKKNVLPKKTPPKKEKAA